MINKMSGNQAEETSCPPFLFNGDGHFNGTPGIRQPAGIKARIMYAFQPETLMGLITAEMLMRLVWIEKYSRVYT